MKRSILTILFLASFAAVGCGSDATSQGGGAGGGLAPAGGGAGSVAGSGNPGGGASGAGTVPSAGNAGVASTTGGASATGGGSPGGGAGGATVMGTGDGPTTMPPDGFSGPVMGTLTAANSTWGPKAVTITGAITVPAGVTLHIQRGTHVSGMFPINVMGGVFNCDGSLSLPVSIQDASLVLTGGSHTMLFCIINSAAATAVDVSGAQLAATHLQIQNFAATGLHIHGAGASAKINFSTLGAKSTLFTGNTGTPGTAVVIDADAAMGMSSITNSVLGFLDDATNIGLKILGPSNTHLAYDNITSTASVLTTTDTPTGILTKAPGIKDIPNLDHNLGFFSPDLDQADPAADFSLEPAPNGGRANLGYYGGTSQATITSVQVISPDGCESLTAGPNMVTWLSSPNTGAKTIELSVDAGTTWTKLADVPAGMDTGSLSVTLPATPTDQAKIRFSQVNDPTHITSMSERVFAIGKPKNAAACANLKPPCATNCLPFKVICYTGYRDGQMPTGQPGANEPTFAQVTEDLTILAKYTHGIRTYGSNPLLHDGGIVPGVADTLGLDLNMGIWIDDSYTDAVNMKALDDSIGIVMAGHKSIKMVIISNEYLLRVRQSHGDTVAAEARLVGYLKYVHSKITTIPVVIGESYPDWLNASKALYDAVDIVMWHVHPWWQGDAIGTAAAAVQTAHESVLAHMKSLGVAANKPEKLAETGFPWGGTTGAAVGSEANQSQYLHDLNQYSLKVNLEYWFFEGFDEAWKGAEGAVGAKWGMWTSVRTAPPHLIITNLATEIPSTEGWN
jgi:exo-beta-1,3-glucanase (GH17 family)